MDKENLGKLLLRLGLGIVFIWFGIDKFFRPELWTGWIPQFLLELLFFDVNVFLYITGVFEVAAGALIAVGLFTRITAGICAAFLFLIVLTSIGGEVLVRDIGLMFLALGIMILGPGKYAVSEKY